MGDQMVFKRYELKYMLTKDQRDQIQELMNEHMVADKYGKNTILSLYLDTPDYLLIRRSLEKPTYKEKLRLRSYGQAGEDKDVFLEMKKKYEGVVYKRRIVLPERQAAAYMSGEQALPQQAAESQIGKELEYFRRFYGDLRPAVYLCYDRTAFCCPQSPELRVTFDRNVRWRTDALALTAEPGGEPLLPEGTVLL
jgi:SPX domain protein involved in polyphosphate accumulation